MRINEATASEDLPPVIIDLRGLNIPVAAAQSALVRFTYLYPQHQATLNHDIVTVVIGSQSERNEIAKEVNYLLYREMIRLRYEDQRATLIQHLYGKRR